MGKLSKTEREIYRQKRERQRERLGKLSETE